MENKYYKTKNLHLGAYLYASGLEFIGTTRIDKEVFFSFTPANKAEQLVNDYYRGTARINPQELFARLSDLKDLIFGGQA